MPVTNIECQIARGQIGRYLAGDKFSAEAVSQLESHISECPGCKAFLSDRKTALQSMMGGTPSPRAVVEVPLDAEPTPAKTTEPKKASPSPTPSSKAAKKPANVSAATFTKPTMYALALAAVLVGMNMFAKAGPMILGPKASAGTAFTALPPVTQTAKTPTAETGGPVPPQMQSPTTTSPSVAANLVPADPTVFESNPIAEAPGKSEASVTSQKPPQPDPKAAEPIKPAPASEPKPKVTAPKVKITSHRVTPRRRTSRVTRRRTVRHSRPAAPKASGNSIRVYDAKGNPIQ